jgi:hypothetical protein
MSFDANAELAALEAHFNDEKEVMLYEADEIALEINVIKRRLAQETILAAVEIGRLLCKAKEKVPHGMWGDWLSENVAYSQSTANNLMRLYKEYGEQEQIDFFAENKMDIFGNLSQSQAIALLGFNYEKRKEYVQTHDMENTSVRDIEADVAKMKAELDEARAECERLDKEREAAVMRALAAENTDEAIELRREIKALKEQVASAEESRDSVVKTAQDNEKAHGKASREWKKEKDELLKQLEEAKQAAEQVTIHEEIAEEKRAEIEQKVALVYEEKLSALRKESEKKIMAAGNPAVIEINILFGELQEAYARISALLVEVEASAPEVADKLKVALQAGIKAMVEKT